MATATRSLKERADEIYGALPAIGHDNSMGLVRYYLATAVIVAHFNVIFGTELPFPTSSYSAVGGFFAISGFLTYRSYIAGHGIADFMLRRIKRVYPPYLFIVLAAAFGLVFISHLPAADYFLNPQWIKYLVCNLLFLNFLAPDLPGVFQGADISAVNGSLWTMKVDMALYASVPAVFALTWWLHRRMHHRRPMLMFAIIYLIASAYRIVCHTLYDIHGSEIYNIMSRQVFGQMMFFYSGVFIYFNYRLFMRHRLLIVAVAAGVICLSGMIPRYNDTLEPAVISCLTMAVSSLAGKLRVFNANNISYGMYLFHFPIIQLLHQWQPEADASRMLPLTFVAVIGLSAATWFGFEKRILRRR